MITNPPLYDYSTLFPKYTLVPPFHFWKTDMTTKNSAGFIRSPPPSHCSRGDYAILGIYSADIISVLFMYSCYPVLHQIRTEITRKTLKFRYLKKVSYFNQKKIMQFQTFLKFLEVLVLSFL